MQITKIEAGRGATGPQGQRRLATGASLGMRMWDREEPGDWKPEATRAYETVGYVLEGRAHIRIDGAETSLEPGDSWVVPQGASHAYKIIEPFTAIEATAPPEG